MWNLGFLTMDQIHIPFTGRQIANHWTTREVSMVSRVLRRKGIQELPTQFKYAPQSSYGSAILAFIHLFIKIITFFKPLILRWQNMLCWAKVIKKQGRCYPTFRIHSVVGPGGKWNKPTEDVAIHIWGVLRLEVRVLGHQSLVPLQWLWVNKSLRCGHLLSLRMVDDDQRCGKCSYLSHVVFSFCDNRHIFPTESWYI